MPHTPPSRFLTRALVAATMPVVLIACSTVDDPIAPLSTLNGQLNLAVVNETGAGMVCGTDAPVTVTVSTVDRRGRVVPAPNVLVNFRAVDGQSDVFAGSAITNASGQAADRVTAGLTPGAPVKLEVRSVDPTGTATTHLALTRPVLMAPTASMTATFGSGLPGLTGVLASVKTGCTKPDGSDAVLAKGTPVTFTILGQTFTGSADGVTDAVAVLLPASLNGQLVTITAGDANTGTITRTFTISTQSCTNPISCL